jgi:hypothetical protein
MEVQVLNSSQRAAIIEAPVTGLAGRTPRAEIERPLAAPGKRKEVIFIVDTSGSNGENAGPDSDMTKQELLEVAIPLITGKLAGDDSEAASEVGTGKGGCRSYAADEPEEFTGFDKEEAEFDDPRDLGDLSEANVQSKLHPAFRGGRTFLMPAIHAAERCFAAEFPDGDRVMEIVIFSDGKASDEEQVERWVKQMAGPMCTVGVVISGYDEPGDNRHAQAVNSWRKIAEDNAHVSLVALTGVSDPNEVALDVQLMAA